MKEGSAKPVEKTLDEKIQDELELSYKGGLFPGQRQTHLQRAQVYTMLLLIKVVKELQTIPKGLFPEGGSREH